jgi:hypothetical protein
MYTIQEIKEMPIEERKEVLALHAKLQKKKAMVTAQVERIPKNGYNKFHNYQYSTESDVKDGIRPILAEVGLSLTPQLVHDEKILVDTKQGKQWLHTIEMEFTLTDVETGYMEIVRSKGEGTDTSDKGIYKAYAGCIKYYLINNFQISTGEKENDPEAGDTEQNFKDGNKNNNQNKNRNNGAGNNSRKPNNKPKATIPGIEAKWKQLNNGSLDGLEEYIAKKNGDLEAIDKALIGRMQARQAQKKKEEKERKEKEMAESFNEDLKEINNTPVVEVSTGKTVEYQGKEIILD